MKKGGEKLGKITNLCELQALLLSSMISFNLHLSSCNISYEPLQPYLLSQKIMLTICDR